MSVTQVIDVYPYDKTNGGIKFLLLHRSDMHIYANQWRMIGGKVEQDEKFWEAGLRELKEETGCNPGLFWTVPSVNHFYEHKTDQIMLIPAFAAEMDSSQQIILNEEHDKFDWVSLEEAYARIFWPEQKKMIRIIYDIVKSDHILPNWII